MDLPALPPKHPELLELEQRYRSIRAQRVEVEAKLRQVETAWSRALMGDEDEAIAEQLADGTLTEISNSNLPAQQADLRKQLEVIARANQKAHEKLIRERERHNNQIIKAFRPAHKAAVQRIAWAVEELVEANKAERMVRQACPVALVNLGFPNIGDFSANDARTAKLWMQHVERLGFLRPDEPEPKPTIKKRRLFSGRGNGAAEPVPLAAKAAD